VRTHRKGSWLQYWPGLAWPGLTSVLAGFSYRTARLCIAPASYLVQFSSTVLVALPIHAGMQITLICNVVLYCVH